MATLFYSTGKTSLLGQLSRNSERIETKQEQSWRSASLRGADLFTSSWIRQRAPTNRYSTRGRRIRVYS